MTGIVKPITTEAAANGVAARTNVSKSKTVRVINTATSAGLVTVTDSDGTTVGTMSIGGGHDALIPKKPSERVHGNAATLLFAGVTEPRG